ncbi:MAG: glycosyltransferase family 4 protein [Dongiaceae bacterium]
MKVAFYAPLKPPTHPIASGDRRMARLLIAALDRAGYDATLASRLRSFEPIGDAKRQLELADICRSQIPRLLRRFRALPPAERPIAWMTYHVYYKAPDWFGPRIAEALAIPYVIVEASHANKRANGPWAMGHEATAAAIRRADAILSPNPNDEECIRPLMPDPRRLVSMPPFLDLQPYQDAAMHRSAHRQSLARAYGLDPYHNWLLAVGMMRPGDKFESYRVLAAALEKLGHQPWHLIVVGDGPERAAVEALMRGVGPNRVTFAGFVGEQSLPVYYAGADILVWPAIGEAYGMAILEAQATGQPGVAGSSGGVPGIVDAGTTGLLAPPGDADSFARALGALIANPTRRAQMRASALKQTGDRHGIARAATLIGDVLGALARAA